MAVDSYDPVTGAPQFSDNGAPDIGVDPTEVAKYAADVGNRIVRANYAGLAAYPYARQGMSGHALDSGLDYLHDGNGWGVSGGADSGWVNVTYGSGWTATSGYTPQVRRVGLQVWLRGAVTSTGGNPQTLLTVPVGFRPANRQWLPVVKSSGTGWGPLNIALNGVVGVPAGGYAGGAFATGNVVPLVGSWWLD